MTIDLQASMPPVSPGLIDKIELFRKPATALLDQELRRKLGQFFTPQSVAEFMAGLIKCNKTHVRLLDAGAGTGILSAATIQRLLSRKKLPKSISVTAFEIDTQLHNYLYNTYHLCKELCSAKGVMFTANVHDDFIAYAANISRNDLFAVDKAGFNLAIVNPPYAKINSDSEIRRMLRSAGIETSNLYTGFLALLAKLLDQNGELVAITPRSFCNGPYFKSFRSYFLDTMSIHRIHVFESRSNAFKDDSVLQENIISYAIKNKQRPSYVTLSICDGTFSSKIKKRLCTYEDIVSSKDPELVIHLTTDEAQAGFRRSIEGLTNNLSDLGLNVSTGRVVDFRAREFLRKDPEKNTVPLIYACHFNEGNITWPKTGGRKPNAIVRDANTQSLLVPQGIYVLTKRFTSKEEKRRIVACIYDPSLVKADYIGFENHLNYFHINGQGLSIELAKGLSAYLNSTLVDAYFRQFNGHTQVNATDLKRLAYPSRDTLEELGCFIGDKVLEQTALDKLIEARL
jgi:adenine-specific DNA-methyltransferase